MGQPNTEREQLSGTTIAEVKMPLLGGKSARGGRSGDGSILRFARERLAEGKAERHLTVREQEILYLICWGMNNAEIGEQLAISARTVEIHRANTLQKLGARNSADAVRIAMSGPLRDYICQ